VGGIERGGIEAGDLAETADGVAEVDGLGVREVGKGEGLLAGGGVSSKDVCAEDARQDAGGERRGEKLSVEADEEGADGAFGELAALVEEENLVEAYGAGLGEFGVVELALGGLVA
jgi:hypothetical protein